MWVEVDTGCGFGEKQVAKYTMIHSEDIQTEERALRAESSLALAWTMCVCV